MIIELIGSSGAGKTSLVRLLKRRGGGPEPIVPIMDLIMDRPGRRWIENPKVTNLVADVTALPSFFRGPDEDRTFVRYAFDRIKRHAPSRFASVNYRREILRNVGKHELARRAGATVLVDEGAVLTAYHLFVYSDAPFDRSDLERFAALVPLPDGIVYVTAPVDVLVDRAMSRPDRRRELAFDDRKETERWIARAAEVFEGLTALPRIADRTLVVDNADDTPAGQAAVVGRIAAFIDDRARERRDSPAPPGATRR
jgi:thymidylate kinase